MMVLEFLTVIILLFLLIISSLTFGIAKYGETQKKIYLLPVWFWLFALIGYQYI